MLLLWTESDAEPTHTYNTESLVNLIAIDPGALIVAEDDHGIVGSVIAATDGWRRSIYD